MDKLTQPLVIKVEMPDLLPLGRCRPGQDWIFSKESNLDPNLSLETTPKPQSALDYSTCK